MTEVLLSELWVQKAGLDAAALPLQGTAIAVIYAVIRRLTAGRSPRLPLRAGCLALTAMAVTRRSLSAHPAGRESAHNPAIQWNISASHGSGCCRLCGVWATAY